MPDAIANQTFGPFTAGTTSEVPSLFDPLMYEWNFSVWSTAITMKTPYPGLYDGQATAIIQNSTTNNSYHSTGSQYGPRFQANEVWSLSMYIKPGTKNSVQFQITNPSGLRLQVIVALNYSYASSYTNLGNGFDVNALNWQAIEQKNGWWWCYVTFSSKVSGIHEVGVSFNDQPTSSLSPYGSVLAYAQGLMLTKTSSGTRYYTAGGTGRVTTPRLMAGDQTFGNFTIAGLGRVPYDARGESSIGEVQQSASGVVYPILLASGDDMIEPFASVGSSRLINVFRSNVTIAPFTQVASAEMPVLKGISSRTIAPFVTNVPGIPTLADQSALVEGAAATARTVPIPSSYGRQRGDAVILIAGAHTDGTRGVNITAPADFTLVGTITAPSATEGYFQTLAIWWRYIRPTDTSTQVFFNLPAGYTNPVVWARTLAVRNVGAVESVWPEVTAGTTIKSHDIGIGGPNRLAFFVAQFSRSLNQQRQTGGWFQQIDERSLTGPGFGSIVDYWPDAEPGIVQRTTVVSTSQPVSTLSIGFAIVPNRTEAHASVMAGADQDIGTFRSIRDAHATADQTIAPFEQDALVNIYRVTGHQTIAPFTQMASSFALAGLSAATELVPFGQDAHGVLPISGASEADLSLGDFLSGIILSKAMGVTQVSAAVSEAAGAVAIEVDTGTLVPFLESAGQMAAIATATGASQIEPFLTNVFNAQADQDIEPFTAYGEGLHDVPERMRGKQAIEPFTSWTWAFSPARPNTAIAGESTFEDFASGSIEGFGAGETTFEGFRTVAIAQVAINATASSQIDAFEQDAGDNVFIRTKQTFDGFMSEEATAVVDVRSDTSTSFGLLEADAAMEVLVSASSMTSIDPLSLGAEARAWVRMKALAQIEPFGQQANALDPDPKPPTNGGIRISGAFRPFGRLKFYGNQVGRR